MMRTVKLVPLFLAAAVSVSTLMPAMADEVKAPETVTAPANQNTPQTESPKEAAPAPVYNQAATRELHELAKNSDAPAGSLKAKASALLKKGANPGLDGEVLCYAALNGRLDVLSVVAEEGGVDLNVRNGQALLLAGMRGRDDVIDYLIDKKMDPDGIEKMGRPLAQTAGNEHLSTIELFVKRGANININNGYPLAIATSLGSIKGMGKLIELGADVNAGMGLALAVALDRGNVEAAQFLLDHGADASLAGVSSSLKEMQEKPEKYATQGHKDVAALIQKARDALPQKIVALGDLPEADQVKKFREEVASRMAAKPARPPVKQGIEKYEGQLRYSDDDGAALIGAILEDDQEAIDLLLKKKTIDPNFNDGLLLTTAAGAGHLAAMNGILDAGADINNDEGIAMMMAIDNAQVGAINLLIERKINLFGRSIELALEHLQLVKKSEGYDNTKYANPVYDQIVDIINKARKEVKPDYVPRIYEAIPVEGSKRLFKSVIVPTPE